MSLSIYASEVCGACKERLEHHFEVTHNLGDLWRFLGCHAALYEGNGKVATTVLPHLQFAAEVLAAHSDDDLARFNAPNGWGTVGVTRPRFLEFVAWLEKHPSATLRVYR